MLRWSANTLGTLSASVTPCVTVLLTPSPRVTSLEWKLSEGDEERSNGYRP
jgi:hypothetical protein